MRFKRETQKVLDSPLFNVLIALLILLSVFLIFAEFLLAAGNTLDTIIELNNAITMIFVVELSLRFWVAPKKSKYFANYWIDILSVLPVLRVFRSLRLLRLLRILRVARAMVILLRQSGWLSKGLERYFGSFGGLFLATLLIITCGTLAFLTVSPPTDPNVTHFDVFLRDIWLTSFLFVSGEVVGEIPATPGAKFVALLVTIAGLVVFAVLVGTVSATMTAFFKTTMDAKDLNIEDLEGHTIICGWDRMGGLVLQELEGSKELWQQGVVIVSETESDIVAESRLKNTRRVFHLKEDFTKIDVLQQAGATNARAAIVLADKGKNLGDQDRDARTVLAALTLEKLNPQIFTCAELLFESNATHLKIAKVEEIISRSNLTAGLLASTIINQGIGSVVQGLLTHDEGNYLKKLPVPLEMIGKPFIEAFEYFKKEFEATILALESLEPSGRHERHINPSNSIELKEGDCLVMVLHKDSLIRELDVV